LAENLSSLADEGGEDTWQRRLESKVEVEFERISRILQPEAEEEEPGALLQQHLPREVDYRELAGLLEEDPRLAELASSLRARQ
jgi:hypothetical protein